MANTVAKLKQLPIKAFTLLESLLVLFVVSFLLLGLSGSVRAGFNQVQEQLFFLEFERLYQESLKRRQLQASILLEALVAMAVFAAISSLLLGQISRSRKEQQVLLQQEEVLRVARMALQTGQEELHINGIAVRQLKTEKQLLVYHEGEVVIRVQKP